MRLPRVVSRTRHAYAAVVLVAEPALRQVSEKALRRARYRCIVVERAGQAAKALREQAARLIVVDPAICRSEAIGQLVGDLQLLGMTAPSIVVVGDDGAGPYFGADVPEFNAPHPVTVRALDSAIAAAQWHGLRPPDSEDWASTQPQGENARTAGYTAFSSRTKPVNPSSAAEKAPRAGKPRFKRTLSFSAKSTQTVPTIAPEAIANDFSETRPEASEPVHTPRKGDITGQKRPGPIHVATTEDIDGESDDDQANRTAKMPALSTDSGLMPSVLVGSYLLVGVLGRGGAATVYRAHDMDARRDVALKVLDRGSKSPDGGLRFRQELEICGELRHPNIVRTHTFGEWNEHVFYSMELLEGADLASMLEDAGGPLDVASVVAWMIQACAGLEQAHKQGVVHRDVKPHNLFVAVDGTVKVMDFGIARRQDLGLTDTGDTRILGTPMYLAPERLSGARSVDHRTDIYALGASMYHLLTDDVPFDLTDIASLIGTILHGVIEPPSTINGGIPAALDAVILRAMARQPSDRYDDCAQLGEALKRALS